MDIIGLGLDFAGKPLFKPMNEGDVIRSLVNAMGNNADHVLSLTRTTAEAVTYRGERQRAILDLGDPKAAGWTFLINVADPHREEIVRILQPLATHRGMDKPTKPLLYNSEPPSEWFNWLHTYYYTLDSTDKKAPQYILIVGGPNLVPFLFQSVLSTVANVGRVDFDTLDDLKHYVAKLIRIETGAQPLVTEEAILFAPDAGLPDPTYFSRQYMVEPLAAYIKEKLGFKTYTIIGDDATKANLADTLRNKKPSLVYTASHGLGAIEEPIEIQRRYNGSICCQHEGQLNPDSLFSADDVLLEQPFLEGAIFFQFACFGYGTPAQSDYAHWVEGIPKQYASAAFVAPLPKKLLAHPRGPIAFIGHLDTAFLHGFVDVSKQYRDRWDTRIAPFKEGVHRLLTIQPAGLALRDMSIRYNACNALITHTYDQQQRGRLVWSARLQERFLDNWITRSDAQNYMIFGDPATHLRIRT